MGVRPVADEETGAPVAYTIKSSTAENGNADIFMAGFPGFAFTGVRPYLFYRDS